MAAARPEGPAPITATLLTWPGSNLVIIEVVESFVCCVLYLNPIAGIGAHGRGAKWALKVELCSYEFNYLQVLSKLCWKVRFSSCFATVVRVDPYNDGRLKMEWLGFPKRPHSSHVLWGAHEPRICQGNRSRINRVTMV